MRIGMWTIKGLKESVVKSLETKARKYRMDLINEVHIKVNTTINLQ